MKTKRVRRFNFNLLANSLIFFLLEQSHGSDEDEDDDDDNITVTVPPASHQRGPVFRETSGMIRISHRPKEIHERHNAVDESPKESEGSHQRTEQFADSYYYNEPYNEHQQHEQHSSYSPAEEAEKNYMPHPQSSGNSSYPPPQQQHMYSQQGPTSQMPMRPQFGQYPGQPHQAPFYPQQQK